jgi:hypothetical protein
MPIPPSQIVRSLKMLAQIKVLSNSRDSAVPAVVAAVTALTTCATMDISVCKAIVLARLADVVVTHPNLGTALAADPKASRAISQLFGAAVAANDTYQHQASITQVATAQIKLRRGCLPFWRRLRSAEVCMHGNAQFAASMLYTRLKLSRLRLLPFPRRTSWRALLQEAVVCAPKGDVRFVANCLLALAYAAEDPELEAGANAVAHLLQAVRRVAGQMNGQEVANTLWAVSVLRVHLDAATTAALVEAVIRTAPCMNAQNVANTALAFGRLGTLYQTPAGEALMQQMATVAHSWRAQEVANTLWGLRRARSLLPEPVCEALLAALARTALHMDVVELRLVLEGLVTLQVCLPYPVVAPILWAL